MFGRFFYFRLLVHVVERKEHAPMARVGTVTLKDTFGLSAFDGIPYLIITETEGRYHFTFLLGGPPGMLYALAFSQGIIKKSNLRSSEVLQ
jgi:hypothetical protein